MSARTGSRNSRPAAAPAYYLGRPASWWITAFARQRAAFARAWEEAEGKRPPRER